MTTNSLVLSEALRESDESIPRGQVMHDLLAPYLNPVTFTAVGVVHGRSNSSMKAVRRATGCLFDRLALVHLDDPESLDELIGPEAEKLSAAFAKVPNKVMAFYAPLTGKTNWALTKDQLLPTDIDASFLSAGLDQ